MYVPPLFTSDDDALTCRLIAENAFAILISHGAEPWISHLPLIMETDGDGARRLVGHVAKPNMHWKLFDGETPATAVFPGPHAYVSPNWYESANMVPTWNYAAVHVHGRPKMLEDFDPAHDAMQALVGTFESDETGNWSMERLTDERLRGQMKGIVAFEMPVERIETKVKMSQNRAPADVAGVIAALDASPRDDDRAVAAMMRDLNPPR